MKIINIKNWSEIPKNFTGKVQYENHEIRYLLNGEFHRLDGPACIGSDDYKVYWINGRLICNSNERNYEQRFYNSKEYKQWILLQSMKSIKNII